MPFAYCSIMIPPRSILAAVDFSEPSRVALTFAVRLARHCRAHIHVLVAEDPLLRIAANARGIDLASETREELERFIRSAHRADGRAPVQHIVSGESTDVICDIADREQVDLIVMGMHGMSGVERAMFGSTTEGVLRSAHVSVLAVPATWTPPRPEVDDLSGVGPVIAGIECKTPAIEAAAAARVLAKTLGTSLELVHVVPTIPVLARWRSHADAAVTGMVETARRDLEAIVRTFPEDVSIRLDVKSGQVAERLAESVQPASGREPILVLGRRVHSDRREAPGTTAYRVLTLARVPVLLYRQRA